MKIRIRTNENVIFFDDKKRTIHLQTHTILNIFNMSFSLSENWDWIVPMLSQNQRCQKKKKIHWVVFVAAQIYAHTRYTGLDILFLHLWGWLHAFDQFDAMHWPIFISKTIVGCEFIEMHFFFTHTHTRTLETIHNFSI